MHFGHVALQVRDLERSVSHATETLGLLESLRDGQSVFVTANEKHHELQLIGTGRSGLDHIGLEVEHRHELDELRDRVVAHGARILSERAEEPGLSEALRCEGPGDVVFEIYAGMERRPLSIDTVLRPFARKVGHVNLLSDEALAGGLISEIVAPEQLMARARELALEIAENTSPVAIALSCADADFSR